MAETISVIGAGIIGVCTALHLQQRGWQVTLIDRQSPGKETSYGNAGVINSGSMAPINSPSMHNVLFSYLQNNKPQLRYNLPHLLRNAYWLLQFLQSSKTRQSEASAKALFGLTSQALLEHKALMQRAGNMHRLTEKGWLKVYREGPSYNPTSFDAQQMDRFDIPFEVLSPQAIHDIEPALKPIYSSGLLLSGAATVNNPGALVSEYAALFTQSGGSIISNTITDIDAADERIVCKGSAGSHQCERLVIAAGPWSDDLLAMLGYSVILCVERGYHAHYQLGGQASLTRSIHDVQGGFVMGPMEMGLRVTTGVELNHRDAPDDLSQLEQILPAVAQAVALGERTDDPIWRGNRPTLPDSKPIIDQLPKHQNIWAAFGHNHIGLMTGPITGRLIAEKISGEKPCIDLSPFNAQRYIYARRHRSKSFKKAL